MRKMMIMQLRRCQHIPRTIFSYVLVACAVLLMLKMISVLNINMGTVSTQCEHIIILDKAITSWLLKEDFSFPGVNETQILESTGRGIGQVKSLYFLEESNFNTLIPDLPQISLKPDAVQATSSPESVSSYFLPGLSHAERAVMLMLFQTFVRACVRANLNFFLYGGTLLGSWRHHDIIPWDDDVDVMLNSSDRTRLREVLSSAGDEFRLYSPQKEQWKFYWHKPNTLLHKPFRWPYIDIFFFLQNDTHIFDETLAFRRDFAFPIQDVFPLTYRPFAGAMLPVPSKTQSVLERNYSPSLCAALAFSHKLESPSPKHLRITVPCKRLFSLYPFVVRRTHGNMVSEELCIG